MASLSPTLIHPEALEDMYEPLVSDFDEPFDGVFTILGAIYRTARNRGMRVLLDGAGGDMVLHECSYILRLIRQGQFRLAIAEIDAERQYWGGKRTLPSLLRYARSAIVPDIVKGPWRALKYRRDYSRAVKTSVISSDFARSVDIEERIERMRRIFQTDGTADYSVECCDRILPNMTAGRERYARIAAAAGMEARDPFMDKRLIDYCSRLPGRFRLRDGWPKIILRDITADVLPEELLWTGRKPHIGWRYSDALTRLAVSRGELNEPFLQEQLADYVDNAAVSRAWQEFERGGSSEQIHYAFILSVWLRRALTRPVVQ
jgi:asparagine synthase (glutamine-hydrolysing)